MIEVKNLHVTFSPNTAMETQALSGADLKVEEGGVCYRHRLKRRGKSTLLAAIAAIFGRKRGAFLLTAKMSPDCPPTKERRYCACFSRSLSGTCASISVEENMSLAADRGTGRGGNWRYRRKNVVCFVSEFALWNWGWRTVWVILSGDYQAAATGG